MVKVGLPTTDRLDKEALMFQGNYQPDQKILPLRLSLVNRPFLISAKERMIMLYQTKFRTVNKETKLWGSIAKTKTKNYLILEAKLEGPDRKRTSKNLNQGSTLNILAPLTSPKQKEFYFSVESS